MKDFQGGRKLLGCTLKGRSDFAGCSKEGKALEEGRRGYHSARGWRVGHAFS